MPGSIEVSQRVTRSKLNGFCKRSEVVERKVVVEKQKNKVCVLCKKEIDHQTYSRESNGWAHTQCQPPSKPMLFDTEPDVRRYRRKWETKWKWEK